jgi:Prealbumin-like fold domain
MKKTLRHQLQDYDLHSSPVFGEAKDALIFNDMELARSFLRNFMLEQSQTKILREVLAGHSFQPATSLWQMSDSQVIDQLATLLILGKLQIAECRPIAATAITAPPLKAEAPEPAEYVPPKPAPKKQEEVKHWVKFQIVDDDSGEAVAGATVEIKLPNGKTQKFKTDKKGEIEIRDLDPGQCDIVDLKGTELLEVVKQS